MGARRLAAWTAAALLAAPAAASATGAPDTLDPGFGSGGVATATLAGAPGGGAGALALDRSGRPVVVSDPGDLRVGVLRFLPNGQPDGAFGGPQPGAAVTVFSGASGTSRFTALAEQGDGGLLAGGFVQRDGESSRRFALARWTAQGQLGTPGTVVDDLCSGDDEITGIAVQPDQRIVVAGRSGGRIGLARYNANGTLDRVCDDFTGATQEEAGGVALDPDGHILVAGTATVGGSRRLALARYTAAGAVDDSFDIDGIRFYDVGTGAAEQALAMAREPDGRIVIAGTTDAAGGGDAIVLRVLADGTPDPEFGTAGLVHLGVPDGVAADVAVQPDGKLVVAGTAADGADSFLARLGPGGKPDPGFGSAGVVRRSFGTSGLSGVGVAPDGGLVAAGATGSAVLLARFTGGDSSEPALTMTAGATGDLVRFTITASNRGADPARDVTVTVAPPAGVRAIGLSTAAGPCAGTICSLGSVAAGGNGRVTLLVRAARPGRLTAHSSVASSTFDANPLDNAAAATGVATALRRPDRTRPTLTVKIKPRHVKDVRKRIRLRIGTSEAARVSFTVRARRKTLAKGRLTFTRKGARTVKLKLTKAGKKVVRRKKLRRLKLVVRAHATDRAGNRTTKTLRKTLRR
jgi:uncharacterized delta-60 repeat protein/uncharacterized repeat protein (TIGR01451 family)